MRTTLRNTLPAVRSVFTSATRFLARKGRGMTLPSVMILGALAGGALLLVSCATTEQGVDFSRLIPGATYVEDKSCEECHAEQVQAFKGTSHGLRFIKNGAKENDGCQSCHGPGSLHVQSGEKSQIVKGNEALCYTCHQRVRSEFSLPYSHPVASGRMDCSDCHSVHGPQTAGTKLVSNETCFTCHKEQRGPWTFEHEPVEHDGCSACHNAHGSVNTRLLTERDYNLCIKCHYSAQYQSIGHYAHRRALNPQTVDPSGRLSTCSGCHRGVHGSNFSKELRTQ